VRNGGWSRSDWDRRRAHDRIGNGRTDHSADHRRLRASCPIDGHTHSRWRRVATGV